MAQLSDEYEQFLIKDTLIVVVGPESPARFQSFWQKNRIKFVGLPDPKHTVLKLYGQEVNIFKLGRMPAQVIIDKEGIVRYVHYGHAMDDIPTNSEILTLIEQFSNK